MDMEEIREDIAAFADNEEDVIVDKGTIVFSKDQQLYECQLFESPGGEVEIQYDKQRVPYLKFLAEQLGRLPILAQAIQQKRPDVNPYIDTQANLTDALGNVVSKNTSALESLRKRCTDRVPGETRLIFLTGDAGEGKTALLRRLTQLQAAEYSGRKSKWFLLHIDTQGRSFVRLEEAVASELGQLRISGLFYSGVIRLIKRGLLAIAIDGFDELLAEVGSGEAYSGLGGFLKQLGGSGVVVAAARAAYFEAENYTAQSRLLSSLPDVQVAVEQMRLEKWGRRETIEFFKEYRSPANLRVSDPEELYVEIEGILGADHVVLSRPFLVQQMARMMVSPTASAREIIQGVGGGLQVVPNVIRSFLKREVEEKWRDTAGQPYLTIDQHIHLLAAIADEMWIQSTNGLPIEMVQLVAETVLDDFGIPISRKVQVLERVKAHALLPTDSSRRQNYRGFDHEEFFNYFLAARLVELLQSRDKNRLARFVEKHSLPSTTAKWIAVMVPWTQDAAKSAISLLSELAASELRAGYLKQNGGLLAANLAAIISSTGNFFDSMYFEGDLFKNSHLIQSEFRRCVFNDIILTEAEWTACVFRDCQIQGVTIGNTRLDGCTFDQGSRVVGLSRASETGESFRTYVPDECQRILSQCGATFQIPDQQEPTTHPGRVPENRRVALDKFLRIFERNTGAVDNMIQLKLGGNLWVFEHEVLPQLVEHNVIRETIYRGRGKQSRYELNYPIESILLAEDPASAAPSELIAFWEDLRRARD